MPFTMKEKTEPVNTNFYMLVRCVTDTLGEALVSLEWVVSLLGEETLWRKRGGPLLGEQTLFL